MKTNLWSQKILFLLVSFLAAAVLYWPSPQMDFVIDDHYVIEHNPLIKSLQLVHEILSHGFFAEAHRVADSGLSYYRPLLTMSFALDYLGWGLYPPVMMLTNLGIHLLNALLVFVVMERLVLNSRIAGLVMLVFLFHPVQEWAVRYLTGRGDVLQGFFTLGMLLAYLQYEGSQKKRWLSLSLLSFLCAILVREAALVNFLFISLVSYWRRPDIKKSLEMTSPFFVMAIFYYGLRNVFFPITQHLDGGLINSWAYVLKFALHLICPIYLQSFWGPTTAALWVVIVVGLLLYFAVRIKDQPAEKRILWLGIIWMGISLLPVVAAYRLLDRLGPVIAEHFLYFGSIGFGLILALVLTRIKNRLLQSSMLAFILILCWSVGLVNGYFWKSEEQLLRHVQYVQGRVITVADEQLAMRYDQDPEKIWQILRQPASPATQSIWYKQLGHFYRMKKDYSAAITYFHQALTLNAQNTEAWDELAVVYFETGHWMQGYQALQSSLSIHPYGSQAYRLMGTSLLIQNKYQPAVDVLSHALQLDPDDREAARLLDEAKRKRAHP